MDIRARSFLSLVKDIEGANDAIIAGGAARDEFLGVKPKDFDIFLPVTGYVNVLGFLINSRSHQTPTILSNRDYAINNLMLAEVAELDYEGIKVQLMGMRSNKAEDEFSLDVINSFDYNLCKIWYDGSVILRDTPEFQSDVNTRQMTLANLREIHQLPKAIERFNRINTHLGGVFSFNCPNLQIVKPKEDVKKQADYYKKYYTASGEIASVPIWNTNTAAPWVSLRWNDVGEVQFIDNTRLDPPIPTGATLATRRQIERVMDDLPNDNF
jgi:hypothetical protein